MAGEGAAETWYVRTRGRILGPLTWEQLRALRHRGQLARFDQVSRDRQGWAAADSLQGLFPPGEAGGAFVAGPSTRSPAVPRREPAPESVEFLILDDEASAGGARAGPGEESGGWYYADAGTPQGPVAYPELKRLAKDGRIGPGTLYWRNGLEQWTIGTDLPELNRLWPFEGDPRSAKGTAPAPPRGPGGEPAGTATRPPIAPLATVGLAANLFCGVGNLAAIVIGVLALRQIARSKGALAGRRRALAGIAIGTVGLAAVALASFWLLAPRGE